MEGAPQRNPSPALAGLEKAAPERAGLRLVPPAAGESERPVARFKGPLEHYAPPRRAESHAKDRSETSGVRRLSDYGVITELLRPAMIPPAPDPSLAVVDEGYEDGPIDFERLLTRVRVPMPVMDDGLPSIPGIPSRPVPPPRPTVVASRWIARGVVATAILLGGACAALF
jgi:hypothetical protein